MKSEKFNVGDKVYTNTHAVYQNTQESLNKLTGVVTNNDDVCDIHVKLDNKPNWGVVGFSEFELSLTEVETYEEFMENYHKKHLYCPKCGDSGNYTITLAGYILNMDKKEDYKDLNTCVCSKCGDKHKYHDRVAEIINIIKVYCGTSIEGNCKQQLHPLTEVQNAQRLIELNKSLILYSNSPDFVSAIKYLCDKNNRDVEFFLDGVSHGNNIEPIFEDFNKALDLIHELTN